MLFLCLPGMAVRHGDHQLFIRADYETSPMDVVRGWRPRGSMLHEWIKSFLLYAKTRPRSACSGGAARRGAARRSTVRSGCSFGDVTSVRAFVRPHRCFTGMTTIFKCSKSKTSNNKTYIGHRNNNKALRDHENSSGRIKMTPTSYTTLFFCCFPWLSFTSNRVWWNLPHVFSPQPSNKQLH